MSVAEMPAVGIKPYYQDDAVTLYRGDCREILPTLGRFDLLLTDPPYGIGESSKKNATRGTSSAKWKRAGVRDYGVYDWDKQRIDESLIVAIRERCDLQVIWGGNYYDLPPCKGPLVWDKENTGDFADGELAWNNLGCALRIKRHMWNGFQRKANEARFHPTQKPLDVFRWCLSFAPDATTILDPFAGSGTTGVAAKLEGRKATLIEMEERYCEIAANRLSQGVLF